MTTPVSGVLSTPAAAAAAYFPEPNPAPAAPASSGFVLSTVDLSDASQALSLEEQGDTPSEIAQALGTSVAIVDGYLGITLPTTVATPIPTQPKSAPAQSSDVPSKVGL